jgi:hypothetical protein
VTRQAFLGRNVSSEKHWRAEAKRLYAVCAAPNLSDKLRKGVEREAEDVEERDGAEGLGGGELVSQPGVHAEGHHRHEHGDHVQQEHVDLQKGSELRG